MPQEALPTQQFIEVEDIREGTLILKSKGLRRVLMVSGVNFELKSEEEQNVILYTYQNFLNSLDFSVQILIHSRKLNIDGYLQKLSERQAKEENDLLKNQIAEYLEFIKSFVEFNAVMAKTFLVVVPYDPLAISEGAKGIGALLSFGRKKEPSAEQKAAAQNFQHNLSLLNQRVDLVVSGLTQVGLRIVPLNDEELTELFYNLYNPSTVEKKVQDK